MPTVEATATTSAAPDAVWALLADEQAWTRWGSWSSAEIEGGGEHGPGAVRVLVARPFRVRERVTTWEPAARMGYELLEGMKLDGYRGEVTLTPDGEGTTVRWRSTWDGGSRVHGFMVKLAIRDACRRVAKAAAA